MGINLNLYSISEGVGIIICLITSFHSISSEMRGKPGVLPLYPLAYSFIGGEKDG